MTLPEERKKEMVREILENLRQAGMVAIIRGIARERLQETLKALWAGGVRAVEITLDTPGALAMLEQAKEEWAGEMLVGAGTALDAETTRLAILAGADFVLAPTLSVAMIETCHRYGKLAVPGVLTPTEILRAWEAGAQLVKVFPARLYGPQYLKDLKGPLPQVEIMPVGGVSLENAGEFMKNGALALGIGTQLVNPTWVEAGAYDRVTQTAKEFMATIKTVRGV